MRAPPFPRSLPELEPWQVFADQLLEQGDRRGAFLSLELSLGAEPTKEQLVSFQKQAQRVCRVPRSFAATWMLGHVRSLALAGDISRLIPLLDGGALPGLRDLFDTPSLANLEQLTLAARSDSIGRRWHEAMRRLPRSCRVFELHANRITGDDVAKILEGIPSQVEVLRVFPRYGTDPSSLVSDRFEWVDLRPISITAQLTRSLANALSSTSRVKVRLGTVSRRSSLREFPRVAVGDLDDAALFEEDPDGAICVFERVRLEALQARFGVLTARAQLGRQLKESFRLGRSLDHQAGWSGDAVIIRADGAWSIHAVPGAPSFTVEGLPLTEKPVSLIDGARVLIDGRPWRFVSSVNALDHSLAHLR